MTNGSLGINSGTSAINLNSIYQANNNSITANPNSADRANAVDGNTSTAWSATLHPDDTMTWVMDLGSSYYVSKIRANTYQNTGSWGFAAEVYNGSWQGVGNFTMDSVGTWRELAVNSNISAVRMTFHVGSGWGSDVISRINELELISNGFATHTTGATQIDGGANFWQWENFTDTKTVPANTSVTYRFRTSANGTDWTGWVGSIGAVTSRTGDDSNNPTKYRYLQIEATLSNTDGASTPTIDQYDIGYHTNQPPNKPTAMTAVVQ